MRAGKGWLAALGAALVLWVGVAAWAGEGETKAKNEKAKVKMKILSRRVIS